MSVSTPSVSPTSQPIHSPPKEVESIVDDKLITSSSEVRHTTAFKKQYKPKSHLSVSQAFKHSCYLCGNLGHHANECEYQVKLCYNCGHPDHRSSECTEPKKNSVKQCFYCKVIGHVQSECPQLIGLEHNLQNNYSHNDHHFRLRRQSSTIWPSSAASIHQQATNVYFQHQKQQPMLSYHEFSPGFNTYYQPIPQSHRYLHPAQPQFTPVHITSYPPAPQSQPAPTAPVYEARNTSYFNQPMVNPVNRHYGNQLLRLRSYSSDMNIRRKYINASYCYTCGAQGHESKNCPINYTQR